MTTRPTTTTDPAPTTADPAPSPGAGPRAAIALAAPVLGLLVALVLPPLWRERLPGRVATHFTVAGEPDRWSSPLELGLGLAAVFVVMLALVSAGLAARWFAGTAGRVSVGLVAGVSTVVAASLVLVLRAQLDAGAARVGTDTALVAALLGLLVGVGAGLLFPAEPVHESARPAPEVTPLSPTERVSWVHTQRAPAWALVLLGTAALVFLALVPATGSAWPLLGAVVVAVAAMATTTITVRIGSDGLRWHSGLGLPRGHVPLPDVQAVEIVDVDPMAHGGWGYRGVSSRRGVLALVLRRGEGLRVTRRGGGQLVVTVDDSTGAAGVLEALRERAAVAG